MSSTNRSSSKPARKPRLILILSLPRDKLSQWPIDVPLSDKSAVAIKPDPSPSINVAESTDQPSDANSTPVPTADGSDPNLLAPPGTDGKKKKGDPNAAPRKRAPPSIDPNRERGRPGPKKKPRLPDGTIDRSQEKKGATPNLTAAAAAAHKLGPKAHQGPINAGLRALDRSGKACRKWERKDFVLKSFTGTTWGMNTWRAPQRDAGFNGDVKSDSAGSSEVKPTQESSVVPSERSNSGAGLQDVTMGGLESSPAPAITA